MSTALRDQRPGDQVRILLDWAEQIRTVHPDQWRRHDVYPAAMALRDAIIAALTEAPWTSYETCRAEARDLAERGHLAWVVGALRSKARRREDVDLEALQAYEDELARLASEVER